MSAQGPGTPMGPPPGPPAGPPAGPPPGGAAPTDGGFTVSWKGVAIALLVVLVGLGIVAAVIASSGDDEAAAADVTLEPVSTAGDNPFMASVGTDETGVTPPARSGGTFEGNTAGLYGGTLNNASCNSLQLVTYLEANPQKAAVWAGVLGINTVDIATYVDGLTPVILRSDVAVTNHGFANGRATTIPAVLQAGTAVLVDKYGFPVVKCFCGNPLTRPRVYADPVYIGNPWTDFSRTSITIIQQTTVVINDFTLVDPRTGESFTRPAGTDGAQDQPTTPTPAPEPEPTPPPPPPPDTQPPGPTAEQQAESKLRQASAACYPFPAPIEDSEGFNVSFEDVDANTFVLQAVTYGGANNQTFRWNVNRSTIQFTPINDLAQVASGHCSQLN